MPRIRCHYADCVFLDEGYCSAAAVEFDMDTGCATYAPNEEAAADGESWDEEELEDLEEDETDDEDDELWLEEEEEEF